MCRIVKNYFDQQFTNLIFTDGSKDPVKGRAGAAVCIPVSDTWIKKRVSDHVSVYTTELLAVILALQWIEEKEILSTVVASDSFFSIKH